MIGLIFLLVPVAIVLYAGIRVAPEYLEFYKISQAMKETGKQLETEDKVTPQLIRGALQKRFDTGYVDSLTAKEIDVVKAEGGWDMTAQYDSTVPMFGNLFLTMEFVSSVTVASD